MFVDSGSKSPKDATLVEFPADVTEAIQQKAADKKALEAKPAVLVTAAHHSRELITIQQNFYTALKMLHGSLHNDAYYKHLLDTNLFYFVPMVNPDGLALIEEEFKKNGKVVTKRKN
mgnify:CR=1 FL=1